MNRNLKVGICLVSVALLAGGFVWFCFAPPEQSPSLGDDSRSTSVEEKSAAERSRKARARRVREAHKEKPKLDAAFADEMVALSAEFKALLAEIQASLDDEDWRRLVKVVQRMQDSDEWPDGIPSVLHDAAIDALKWFGASTAPELVGYLASREPDVVESAIDAMLDTLADFSISDHERSALLLGYLKVVNDADTIDTMFMELDSMRPTVRAQTAISIVESGNEVAINLLKENVEFFFGDLDDLEVTDINQLKAYLEKAEQIYAEDPEQAADDEEFYGGDKDLAP